MKLPTDMTIDLLRHGETERGSRFCGITDDRLSTVGWDRMWSAVEYRGSWECVISSPLRRCAEFAQAYATKYSLSLTIDTQLQEIHFGRWEGRSSEEIWSNDGDALTRFWNDPWHNPPPGGESLEHLQTRVLAAWNDIVSRSRRALVVTHGGPIRVVLCHEQKTPVEKLIEIEVPHATLWRLPIPSSSALALSAS